jgi:hypothetical protein
VLVDGGCSFPASGALRGSRRTPRNAVPRVAPEISASTSCRQISRYVTGRPNIEPVPRRDWTSIRLIHIRARDYLSHQQAGCIAAFSSCEHQKKFPLACRGVHVYAHYAAAQRLGSRLKSRRRIKISNTSGAYSYATLPCHTVGTLSRYLLSTLQRYASYLVSLRTLANSSKLTGLQTW